MTPIYDESTDTTTEVSADDFIEIIGGGSEEE